MKLVRVIKSLLRQKVVPKKPPYEHITQIGDPVLRYVCKPIDPTEINTDKTQELILHMKNLMRRFQLFGLSAPQVGLPLRLFIIAFPKPEEIFSKDEIDRLEMKSFPHMVWINPEMKILDYKTKITEVENCGSLKSLQAQVSRFRKVQLTGLNESGESTSWTADGWAARMVQHEMDHLNGTLFTDCMLPKTLECISWHDINLQNGLLELRYYQS
uniref:Peptide deformylase n=1 Tax=Cacopsylla melanoneura TaxID=428564 RepID=A0A8D8WP33_9HEMI